jgi:hypothetical protein
MKVCFEVQVMKGRFYDRLHELVAKRRPAAIAAIASAQGSTSKAFNGSIAEFLGCQQPTFFAGTHNQMRMSVRQHISA